MSARRLLRRLWTRALTPAAGGPTYRGPVGRAVEQLEDRSVPATLTWVGDQDANWNTDNSGDTNWSGDARPANGDTLIFAGAAVGTLNNDTTAGNIYALQFTADGYTITGNAITLSQTATATAFAIQLTTGSAVLNTNLTLADTTNTIDVQGTPTNQATLLGVVSGAAANGLVKTSGGTLRLANTGNSYDGQTAINAGSIVPDADGALGSTTGGTVVNAGGTLSLGGVTYATAEPLQLNGTGGTNTGALQTNGAGNTFAGDITLGSDAQIAGDAALTLSGSVNSLGAARNLNIRPGAGTSAGVTFQGLVGNTLALDSITQQANVGTLTFEQDVTLGTGTTTFNGSVTLDGLTFTSGGVVTFGDAATDTLTISGGLVTISPAANQTVTVNAPATLDNNLELTGAGNFDIPGNVGGAGTLTKGGGGTATLSGTNTYTGTTAVNFGTLALANGAAIPDAGAVTVDLGATLRLDASEAIGSLAGAGAVNLQTSTLTTGGANTSTTFSGSFSGTAGSLTKAGTGTFTVSGTSTIAGTLTVQDGTLAAGAATLSVGDVSLTGGTFTAPTNTLSVAGNWSRTGGTFAPNGGTVDFTAATGLLSLNPGGEAFNNLTKSGASQLTVTTTPLTVNGNLTVSAGNFFLNNQNLTVNGTVSNTASIFAVGTETVTLANGNDTDSGTWTFVGNNTVGPLTLPDFGTTDYFNLTIADTGGTPVTFQAGAALAVGGTFVVGGGFAGTYDANGNTTTVTGLTQVSGGTYTAGTATQNLNGGLSVSSGTFTGSTGTVATTDVTLGGGTLTAPSTTLSVSGNFSRTGGTFAANGGTVTFTAATGTQTLDSGGQAFTNVTHTGAGALEPTTPLTVGGTLTTSAGTLLLNTTVTGPIAVSGGTLAGTGTVTGTVTVAAGGTLAPGASAAANTVGTLTLGGLVMQNGSTLQADVVNTATSDRVVVTGATLTLTTPTLAVTASADLIASPNQRFRIIQTGTAATGTFSGRPEGAQVAVTGSTAPTFVTYQGGTDTATDTNVDLLTQPIVIGTGGNDTLVLRQLSATQNEYSLNGGAFIAVSSAVPFAFVGGAGADMLYVDTSNGDPIPTGGVMYDGEVLRAEKVTGAATEAVTLAPATTPGSGTLTITGFGDVTYTGVGGPGGGGIDLVNFTTVAVRTGQANDTLNLSDNTTIDNGGAVPAGYNLAALPALLVGETAVAGVPGVGLRRIGTAAVDTFAGVGGDGADAITLDALTGTPAAAGVPNLVIAAAPAGTITGAGAATDAVTIAGAVNIPTSLSVAANGPTTETTGTVTTAALTTNSKGGTGLGGANAVGTFSAANATGGDITLANTTALTVAGVTQAVAGNVALTAPTVSGGGAVSLGGVLTVAVSAPGSVLSGVISGAGAGLTKQGAGSLTLAGANTYTGATIVAAGRLDVTGSITSSVTVTAPGTLGGTGTVAGNVTGTGTVAPGGGLGVLTVVGDFTPTGTVAFQVYPPATAAGSDHDQLVVGGTVTLAGTTLAVTRTGPALAVGRAVTLIDNDGTDAVDGTFAGLPEGSVVAVGGQALRLSYAGGTGNDVTLTPVVPSVAGGSPDGTVRVLTAGANGQIGAPEAVPVFQGVGAAVRATVGDVDGDGTPDLVAVTGPGVPVRVTVLSGADQSTVLVPAFDPFGGGFTGGGFVTTGDLDGDGRAEVVVTPDQGGGPRVVVFGVAGGKAVERASFFGIADPDFRGGVRADLGDVNGDGVPDLAVAAGFLGGPRAALFDGATLLGGTPTKLVSDFFAFPGADAVNLRNGAFVAIGDLDGDGFGDLIFGGGPGGAPRVFALSGARLLAGGADDAQANPVANFFVGGDAAERAGARVAAADLDGDARADMLVGIGTGSTARVRAYRGVDFTGSGEPAAFQDVTAFDESSLPVGGVFVG